MGKKFGSSELPNPNHKPITACPQESTCSWLILHDPLPLWSWPYYSFEHIESLCRDTPSASLESLSVHLSACVYFRCIVVSAASLYVSLQPERPHLDYTRRGLPRALRGFCLHAFPQKLSPSAQTQGKRAFLSLNPILSVSLSLSLISL